MRLRTVAAACLGLAIASLPSSPARAQDLPSPAVSAPAVSPNSPRVTPWEAAIGYRGAFVENAGYAPFSTKDYFSQFTLGASRVVLTRGRLALAVGATWEYGESSATARGAQAQLEVHRLTVPVTLRFRLTRRLDAFARVAPGATHERARVDDSSAPAPLVKSAWLPCGDATLGLAWAFADSRLFEHPVVWRVTAEGGYAWTADLSLALQPDLPGGDPRLTGPTDLGSLALSGGFGRIGFAVGF